MRRQPTEHRVMLTPRDLEILSLLGRYRYLRSSHFYPLIGGKSRRRFIERLGLLYHEGGYVNRPARQWQAVNARYMPAVYELGEAGEAALIERGLAAETSPLLHRGRGQGMLFHHELMVSDILSSIEIGIRARPDLRFIAWPEILDKAPRSTQDASDPFEIPVTVTHRFTNRTETWAKPVKPDAVFGIEYRRDGKKTHRFFALEADRKNEPVYRGTLEQTSYLRKLLQYREVLRTGAYRTHLGVPNFYVLTVTTAEPHLRSILELLAELTDGKGQGFMLFRTMPSLASLEMAPPPTPFILDTPWRRAGHPDLLIDRL
jgi:hypothetical protein